MKRRTCCDALRSAVWGAMPPTGPCWQVTGRIGIGACLSLSLSLPRRRTGRLPAPDLPPSSYPAMARVEGEATAILASPIYQACKGMYAPSMHTESG